MPLVISRRGLLERIAGLGAGFVATGTVGGCAELEKVLGTATLSSTLSTASEILTEAETVLPLIADVPGLGSAAVAEPLVAVAAGIVKALVAAEAVPATTASLVSAATTALTTVSNVLSSDPLIAADVAKVEAALATLTSQADAELLSSFKSITTLLIDLAQIGQSSSGTTTVTAARRAVALSKPGVQAVIDDVRAKLASL